MNAQAHKRVTSLKSKNEVLVLTTLKPEDSSLLVQSVFFPARADHYFQTQRVCKVAQPPGRSPTLPTSSLWNLKVSRMLRGSNKKSFQTKAKSLVT
jgi:hypothetical protein